MVINSKVKANIDLQTIYPYLKYHSSGIITTVYNPLIYEVKFGEKYFTVPYIYLINLNFIKL